MYQNVTASDVQEKAIHCSTCTTGNVAMKTKHRLTVSSRCFHSREELPVKMIYRYVSVHYLVLRNGAIGDEDTSRRTSVPCRLLHRLVEDSHTIFQDVVV